MPNVLNNSRKTFLQDGQILHVGDFKIECFQVSGNTGQTDNSEFAFAHKDKLCSPFKKKVHDPSAPYDAYEESDDTEEKAKSGFLPGVCCKGART